MSFTVRSIDQSFADAMAWHLGSCRRATPDQHAFPIDLFVQEADLEKQPRPYSFFLATSPSFSHPSLADVLNHALWAVNAAIPKRVKDFLLLHSGAAARSGDVLLLPAQMECGKSSVVAALCEGGWHYLSDEFGALDPVTLRAYPAPTSISLGWEALRLFPGLDPGLADRPALIREVGGRFFRPEDLGTVAGVPGRVRWIVFPQPVWEGPARLTAVSSAEAVERMANACFNMYRYGPRGVTMLARIAREAKAYALEGGSPRDRAALLSDQLTS